MVPPMEKNIKSNDVHIAANALDVSAPRVMLLPLLTSVCILATAIAATMNTINTSTFMEIIVQE